MVNHTHYSKKATDADAPASCNCLTAIRHLIAPLPIPRTWIGDLPALLLSHEWTLHTLSHAHLEPGDLLFFKNHNRLEQITHIALALSSSELFHCTSRIGGCEIVNCHPLHERYSLVSAPILTTYQDPRHDRMPELSAAGYRPLAPENQDTPGVS